MTLNAIFSIVTSKVVEFEKLPAEFQDFKKITDKFRGIYIKMSQTNKGKPKMLTCNRLDLETRGSPPVMPRNLPGQCQGQPTEAWRAGRAGA